MSLTVIFGEAGTGKSEYCTTSMLSLAKKGAKVLMIVPEQFAHAAESYLLEKNGFLSEDIQATSFKRLAQKMLRNAGMLNNSVSRIGKSMLLARAVLQNADSLVLYQNSAAKPGFIDAMLSFISECKRSGITPSMLTENINMNTENDYLALKLKELSIIYSTYQDLLSKDLTDSDDYLAMLSEYILDSHTFQGDYIFIDEFFRFTPAELSCIRAFLLSGAHVFVTLGAKNQSAAGIFEPVVQTAKALEIMAKNEGIPVNPPICLTEKHRFESVPDLAHFENEYHRFSHREYADATKNLSLYITQNPYTETQLLAANICRAVKERGLHYRDIAIIAGNTDIYSDMIKTVFPAYDIPVFIDKKRSLLSHPIIIMLFSLLELMSRGVETEALLAFAKTGYSPLTRDETDILENFALAGRLHKQDWLNDERFLQRADSVFYETESMDETNAENAEQILEIRNRLLAPLLSLRTSLSQSRLLKDRASAIFTFFEDIALYQKVSDEIKHFEEEGQHQNAEELGEIFNLLIGLLDELVNCLGNEKIGMTRLTSIISAGLSQCEIATIPPGNDHVFFGDLSRSLIKNVKALFVVGVNDAAFPPQAPQEGILKDTERAVLTQQGLDPGPDSKKITLHNQFVMYNALCASSGSLTFSYPVADVEGKGLRPAPLIQRLRKIFPRLTVSDYLIQEPEADRIVAGLSSGWQYMLEHFNENTSVVRSLKKLFENHEDYRERYQALLRSRDYKTRKLLLSDKMATSLYGRTLYSSVTRLEKFSSCPFAYFLQYGLKAKERKILKIDTPDIGSLLHRLVELASKRIVEEGKSFGALSDEDITHIAETTVDELLSTLFISKLYTENRLSALVTRLKALVGKMLQIICTHIRRGEFEPCAFEVSFSENGEIPPVTINLPTGEKIVLVGKIDRIDAVKKEASVYIKIIDYKTGNKDFKLSEIYSGLSLQLAIYLTAVTEGSEALLGDKAMPAGMFYFRLADKTVDANDIKSENDLIKQFKMQGLLLKDSDIIRAMDKGISGYSSILPAYMKQDGTVSESLGSYATYEQFLSLSKYVRHVAGEIGREILHGTIAISPCKGANGLPCEYCRFHSVCGFDVETDSYRISHPLKNDIFWSLLEKEWTDS
ncbi:MAG: helicase-exonuclease AddAB subunit AddB [Clostridia bacterium]|nr:helicase-exonuclease AddAB subunit AddB [Clostridia bacterium]